MKRTALLILGAALVYELVALDNHTDGDTWSELVWAASSRPLIPFTLGLLAGHLVWQRTDPTQPATPRAAP
jgi:hypothetical protein